MNQTERLARLVDETLVGAMPEGLKAAIDAALKAGAPKAEILRRVKKQTKGLVYQSVEAYLEGKGGGR